jgi:phage baseplate assembly protein W
VASEFLGVGWAFQRPPGDEDRLDIALTSGQVAMSRYEEDLQEAIAIILGTSRGERVMRPDFGCGLRELVFAGNDATTAGQAERDVRQALALWEPRIVLLDVEVTSGGPTTLLIRVAYRVRVTNNVFNLVYPFYLE